MQIRCLTLKNFKSFAQRTVIPMAPLTLLFGENSAGKSSILHSILMLCQTLPHVRVTEPELRAHGDLVDLGSVCELIYRHDPELECEISVMVEGEELGRSDLFWFGSDHLAAGAGVGFSCSEGPQGSPHVVVRSMPIYWGTGDPQESLLFTLKRSENLTPAILAQRFPSRSSGTHPPCYEIADVREGNPVLAWLFRYFQSDSERVLRALREWPTLDSIKEWKRFSEIDSPYYLDNPLVTANGFLERIVNEWGYDPISDLCAPFLDYSYEDYIRDMRRRSDQYWFCVRGFLPYPVKRALHLVINSRNGQPAWMDSDMRAPEDPQRPSVEEVWCNLFHLLNHEDPGDVSDEGIPYGCRDILLPNLADIAKEAGEMVSRALERVVYIGPLRHAPERLYRAEEDTGSLVGKTGEKLPGLLWRNEQLREDLNEELRIFQADHQLSVVPVGVPGMEGRFGLRLIDTHTGAEVSPADVGFGVGQVLPVLSQCLLARRKIVMTEQPELHLHPRLQAELGEFFARRTAEPYNNQVIVETHSQYIIYRVQKLIRQGRLRPEDVSVLYVLKDAEGSHCLQLRLDDEGDFIDEWPNGFFEEGYKEMFGP